jgi:hypothetical protein
MPWTYFVFITMWTSGRGEWGSYERGKEQFGFIKLIIILD